MNQPRPVPASVDALRDYLVEHRLAGEVNTSPANSVGNCRKVVDGHPEYTFGLSDWKEASFEDVRAAVAEVCGERAVADEDDRGDGWIEPDACVEGIERHRRVIAEFARSKGRVLLATGHPTGLLPHYAAIARRLLAAGCSVLRALDDEAVQLDIDRRVRVRYLDGVACLATGADLLHTHRSGAMEQILDALEERGETPDLVVGDHGFGGAAVERGYETLSIADVNDPALQLAMVKGRTEYVLPIDDNLAPTLFEPVTGWMLGRS